MLSVYVSNIYCPMLSNVECPNFVFNGPMLSNIKGPSLSILECPVSGPLLSSVQRWVSNSVQHEGYVLCVLTTVDCMWCPVWSSRHCNCTLPRGRTVPFLQLIIPGHWTLDTRPDTVLSPTAHIMSDHHTITPPSGFLESTLVYITMMEILASAFDLQREGISSWAVGD